VTDYLKLTAYFTERLRHADRFLSDALLDLYGGNSVATSVVLRGIASFGPHHVLRSDQSLSMSEDSPIAVAAVDSAEKMVGLADQVAEMVSRGLMTLERAHLGGSPIRPPDAAKLTVYVGRQDRADGRPAYRAVCVRCCIDTDSQAPQCFSASTARPAGSAEEPASSAATSECP
jgi:PII-like signaling protein